MAITNLTVSNFKSFKHLDLNLGRFNVVIGANASGKSNFVEVFRFLRTLERENLNDALSLHGGPDSILNKKLGPSESLRMRVTFDQQGAWAGPWSYIRVCGRMYEFGLQLGDPQNRILVERDRLVERLRVESAAEDMEMTMDIHLLEGRPKVEFAPKDVVDRLKAHVLGEAGSFLTIYMYLDGLWQAVKAEQPTSLLMNSWLSSRMLMGPWESLFGRLCVYDIDPHAVKKAQEMPGRASLEEDGRNLALVLKSILTDPEKSRKFHNLLRYMLPFAMEVGTEQYLGTSLLLKLREEYYEESLLANLLSDGTVDVVALITALFFEDKDVVIIEEPERNIHPRLISGLVELMKDAARNKQVIVTTHSPELVKHAGLENLLLISRDKEGFSTISRPAEKETVKIFLEHDLGLDDLFVRDILAAP